MNDSEIAQQADANIQQKRAAESGDPNDRNNPDRPAQAAEEVVTRMNALFERAAANTARVEKEIAGRPVPKCQKHGAPMPANLEKSAQASFGKDHVEIVFECHKCESDKAASAQGAWLSRAGVPEDLIGATFENWKPRTREDVANLKVCRAFASERKGFLLLLGAVGVGKTHLAVAVMQSMGFGIMRTQKRFIAQLRARYSDDYATDIVQKCMNARLFVYDELEEVSGRDELPAILDVLDHRHGNHLPTIITSNLDWKKIGDVIGERMADRLTQSAFEGSALVFAGESMRKQSREKYFSNEKLTQDDPPQ